MFSKTIAREYLRKAIAEEKEQNPFNVMASVILPDHLHCIWELPENDADFSKRWGRIKRRFSKKWINIGGKEAEISQARRNHHERGVWQKRFWEHRIRDEEDLMRHVNYIHYNPVKHGLVRCPHIWPYSSFEQWVKEGYYRHDWLCDCDGQRPAALDNIYKGDTFGE